MTHFCPLGTVSQRFYNNPLHTIIWGHNVQTHKLVGHISDTVLWRLRSRESSLGPGSLSAPELWRFEESLGVLSSPENTAAARDPVGVKGPKPSSSLCLCSTESAIHRAPRAPLSTHEGIIQGCWTHCITKVPFTGKVSHVLIEKRCFTFSVWHHKR